MPHSSTKSARLSRTTTPKKPHPDYPLTPRKDGRWCKKVRGRIHIFTGTAAEALAEWLRVKDDLVAGRKSRPLTTGLTTADLCNHFLTFKEQLRDGGEIAPRTYARFYATCEFLIAQLGRNRVLLDLGPDDFQALRGVMAKRWGPVALGNEIQIIRTIFRYGFEAGIIDKPVRFGPGFKKPSAKVLRKERAAGGPKMFTAEQIKALLEVASPNVTAMILLAINGGLGNTDLGELPIKAIDFTGWLDYPRPKTGIERRIPLWPETIAAVREAIAKRRKPLDDADAGLLFIGARGESYAGEHKGYRVAQEFKHALEAAKITGRTFYDLRRTFQTIAEGAHDLVAVQAIMGHAPSSGDMSAVYRQRVDDKRLLATSNHVRKWLFGKAVKRG